MTTYRVGSEGATVFSTTGEPLCTLMSGQVVVAGVVETPASTAAQYARTERVRDVRAAAVEPPKPACPNRSPERSRGGSRGDPKPEPPKPDTPTLDEPSLDEPGLDPPPDESPDTRRVRGYETAVIHPAEDKAP